MSDFADADSCLAAPDCTGRLSSQLRVKYRLVWSLRIPLRRELPLGSLLFAFLVMIAATDYLFRGKVRIGPEAFEAVYRRM